MALCALAQGQTTPAGAPPAVAAAEIKGMPPRASAAEFPVRAQVGHVTIAAEFTGHGVGTPQGALTTEDYVVVELGLYGAPEARAKISLSDFSLRINGKKALPGQQYGMVLSTLKDPEWQPPEELKPTKSKMGGVSAGGGGPQAGEAPTPPKMTFAERRAMEQKVQKAALPEGDRALPVAGLLFFQYRGKDSAIKSAELVYEGPAGKATMQLQK